MFNKMSDLQEQMHCLTIRRRGNHIYFNRVINLGTLIYSNLAGKDK